LTRLIKFPALYLNDKLKLIDMRYYLVVFLILLNGVAKSALIINNQTNCCTIQVAIFCHDNIYNSCQQLQSQTFYISPNSQVSFQTTENLGGCFVGGSLPFAVPQPTNNWDAIKFYGTTTSSTYVLGSVGPLNNCVGIPTHSDSPYFVCGESFEAICSQVGGNTYVSFGAF
jgi:hypothetical protein